MSISGKLQIAVLAVSVGIFWSGSDLLWSQDGEGGGRGRRGGDGEAGRAGRRGDREKDDERQRPDIETVASLKKPVDKGSDVWEISYAKPDRKGRLRKTKARLEIPHDVAFYRDRQIRLRDLSVEEEIWVFGRPVEREVADRDGSGLGGGGRGGGGRGGGAGGAGGIGGAGNRPPRKDRQIQAARFILVGDDIEAPERYRNKKAPGFRWVRAEVEAVHGGLWVKYEGESYRVAMEKRHSVLRRTKIDRPLTSKDLRKVRSVHVRGDSQPTGGARAEDDGADTGSERGKKADDKKRGKERSQKTTESFKATRLIGLDPKLLKTAYRALFP